MALMNYVMYYANDFIVNTLIRWGFDFSDKDRRGNTPLHIAVIQNRNKIIPLLLAKRALLDIEDRDGNTALHLAVKTGNIESVQQLIRHGTNVNYVNKKNWRTPLHYAVMYNHDDILAILLAHGADVAAKTGSLTALHIAAERNNEQAVSLLLRYGAPIHVFEDSRGTYPTPLDYTIKTQNDNIINQILTHCANSPETKILALFKAINNNDVAVANKLFRFPFPLNGNEVDSLRKKDFFDTHGSWKFGNHGLKLDYL